MHHTDQHIDASTSLRFHPFETIFRAAFETGVVYLLGLPPEGLLISFAVHAAANTITHTNIALSPQIDRLVSTVFITPHVHRLHHSTAPEHLHRNFGTVFSVWDRLFGTFCPPGELTKSATFGVNGPENIEHETFGALALDPFRKPPGGGIPQTEYQEKPA